MTRNNRQQRKNRNGARRSGSCAYCHKAGHYARDKQRQITCPVLFAAEERKKRPAPSKILTVQPRKALSTAKLTEALDNGTLVSECTYKGRTNRSRPPAIVTQFSGLDFSSDDDSPSPTDHPNVEWRCKLTYGSGSTASMKAELLELQAELDCLNCKQSWRRLTLIPPNPGQMRATSRILRKRSKSSKRNSLKPSTIHKQKGKTVHKVLFVFNLQN